MKDGYNSSSSATASDECRPWAQCRHRSLNSRFGRFFPPLLCAKIWTRCQTEDGTTVVWGGRGFGWRFNLRIRSVPGNNTLPRTISAMIQPTDQTSTEKWNDNHRISMQDWKPNGKKNENKNKRRGEIIIHKHDDVRARWHMTQNDLHASESTLTPGSVFNRCLSPS